jgi:hypothetical protein
MTFSRIICQSSLYWVGTATSIGLQYAMIQRKLIVDAIKRTRSQMFQTKLLHSVPLDLCQFRQASSKSLWPERSGLK